MLIERVAGQHVPMAGEGGFINAPDNYMDKIEVGGGLTDGIVDLDAEPGENLKNLAKAKKMDVSDLVVCILDRPRHSEIIAKVRAAGARILMIGDGDVSGVIATSRPESGVDMYVGIGGAPEGVLAAAALRCIGGQFQGRLVFRNDDERARAQRCGITDFDRKYSLMELANGDVMFAATGVTTAACCVGCAASRAARQPTPWSCGPSRARCAWSRRSIISTARPGTTRSVSSQAAPAPENAAPARPNETRACFLGVEYSLTGKRWEERLGDAREAMALSQRLGVPEVVGRIMAGRGVGLDEAPAYLEPSLRAAMPDPSCLRDMDRAVDRLVRALKDGETIAIFGDYDVDGATSAALLARFLGAVGQG